MNQTFQRIDGPVETGIQHLDLFSRERLQHIVRRILTRCRSADSDLDPHKLGRPDCVNDRLDSVMSPMPTGLFDPETPQIKIEIVVDEDQVVGGQRKLTQEAFERRTGDVHPVEGAGEFEEFRAKPSRSTMSHAALGEMDGPPSCGPLDDPHADVVAGLGIDSARVAQPNDEAQRYFFFSVSFFSAFGATAPFFSPPFASASNSGRTGFLLAAFRVSSSHTGFRRFATLSGFTRHFALRDYLRLFRTLRPGCAAHEE